MTEGVTGEIVEEIKTAVDADLETAQRIDSKAAYLKAWLWRSVNLQTKSKFEDWFTSVARQVFS
jgi:hypothetical protein